MDIFPRKNGVYIVGGSIRDLLCKRAPKDYDLAVAENPDQFAGSLASHMDGHVVKFGKHGHKILRVIARDHFFDIMPVNGQSIDDDLNRRDFTINAMALDASTGDLIDPTGGQRDLQSKTVRMVAPNVFRQDPLRLLRAYRMATSFDLTIEKDTINRITRDAGLIRRTAGERIREEMFKILQSSDSHSRLTAMADSGVLHKVLPELYDLKKWADENERPGFFYNQAFAAYNRLEILLNPLNSSDSMPVEALGDDIDLQRIVLLKWAVLLQSTGRISSRRSTAGSTVKYCGHAARSADTARRICRRLKFSRHDSDTIEFIVRHHNWPFFLFRARQKKVCTDRAFIRFFMKCGDRTPDILLHARVGLPEQWSGQGSDDQRFFDFVDDGLQSYHAVLRPRAMQPLPLNGNDLIKHFGLKPSAKFRRILRSVKEAHLASEDFTREQALELVEALLNKEKI